MGKDGGEFSGGELSVQTRGQSGAILELMNLILASVHVQGEGDAPLVLAFLPAPSA